MAIHSRGKASREDLEMRDDVRPVGRFSAGEEDSVCRENDGQIRRARRRSASIRLRAASERARTMHVLTTLGDERRATRGVLMAAQNG